MPNKYKVLIQKIFIHVICLGLIGRLYYFAIQDDLGADPVEAVLHFTGIGALNLLLLGLVVSPVVRRFKLSWLMQVRRLIGLYAFVYALCHIASFLAFEVQFDMVLFLEEIINRPYITVGMVSFMFLLALAITSLNTLKRQMGKRWQKLHNWVYFAIALASVHFYWSVKADVTEPLIYFAILAFLLSLRKYKFFRK